MTKNIIKKLFKNPYFDKLIKLKKQTEVFQSEEEIKSELIKEVKKVLLATVAVAAVIVFYVCSYKIKEDVIWDGNIEKTDYEKEYKVAYEIDEEISGSVNLKVPQRNYQENEACEMFEQVKEKLDEVVLNGNDSLDKVENNLYFPDSIAEYPVDITWSTDNEEILDAEGQVFNFEDNLEVVVMVTALLSLGEYEEEYSFPVGIVSPESKDGTWWKNAVVYVLEKSVKKAEKENLISLPKEVTGNKVSFSVNADKRPWELLLGIPVVFVLLMYGNLKDAESKQEKKVADMIREYPEIVSRLSLYIQAGMTGKNAIGKMVQDYENTGEKKSYAYEELKRTYHEMKSGISENEAYKNMAERIKIAEYKKLSNILLQQLEKGSKDFVFTLQQETVDAFEKRKRNAREAGEKAGTKLLLPMGIMFGITLVIIMVPAFFSFAL